MRLNHEFVRSLLLYVEENPENSSRREGELLEFAKKHSISKDNLIYTIQRLDEAGYIKSSIQYASNKVYWFAISSITWSGHEFLDTIRDPKIWRDTKEKTSKLASVSLNILSEVASSIVVKTLGL